MEHLSGRLSLQRLIGFDRVLKPEEKRGSIPDAGTIYRNTFRMAWPSALESVLVSLINSVDTIMVGGLGAAAIAAVGITTQPKFVLLVLIFSLNSGVTTVVARRRGEQDAQGANRCLRQTVLLCAVLSTIMAVLGYCLAAPFMQLAGAGEDILGDAVAYFRINMLGFPFMCLGLTINSAQRGAGNTKISMRTNLTANGVNVVLNYLLIGGNFGFPALGVRGAAIATIIGQFVGFLMSVRSVTVHHSFLQLSLRESWAFDRDTMGSVAKISSGAILEQLFMRIGFFAYSKIVAELGTDDIATNQICSNIINLSFSFGDGFSIAVSSLVGQSLGSKRPDLAKIYVKSARRLMTLISLGLCLFFWAGRYSLVRLFTDDPDIIKKGSQIMYIIAIITLIQTAALVYSGCLRGAGDAKFIALMALISIGIIRPISAWIFCYPCGFGLVGAWCAMLLDQCIRWTFNYTRFRSGNWQKIKV